VYRHNALLRSTLPRLIVVCAATAPTRNLRTQLLRNFIQTLEVLNAKQPLDVLTGFKLKLSNEGR